MVPATKHLDLTLGVDIHLIQPPGPVPPIPVPHPFVGVVVDPFDYVPVLGATIYVNGLPRAIAGTAGAALPPHLPIGGVFVKPPANECELFMGSATVTFDGDAAGYMGLPVLSCQCLGMPAPVRANPKKKTKLKSLVLPTSVALSIPLGRPVFVGGPPTVSAMALGGRAVAKGLGAGFRRLRRLQRESQRLRRLSQRLQRTAARTVDTLGMRSTRLRNRVRRALCTATGHPVDVATGKVFTERVDLALPGPLPLVWERVWFSSSDYDGPLGHGWHHPYDLALYEDTAADVAVVRLADGRCAPFALPTVDDATGEPVPSWNSQERLFLRRYVLQGRDRGYVMEEDGGGRRYVFGQIGDERRRAGPGLRRHALLRIEDAHGNALRFFYSPRGHLEQILDTAGRRIGLQRDARGRIVSITGPHPTERDRPSVLVTYRYDRHGDLVEVKDALGTPETYAYREHLLVKETDRAGVTFQFAYDRHAPDTPPEIAALRPSLARCTRTWGTGGIYARDLHYDEVAQTTVVTDTRGARTTYAWNALGLVTRETDAFGHATTHDYDDDGRLLATTDPLGYTTTLTYDVFGRVVAAADPLGGTRKIVYDALGRMTAVRDELGNVWSRELDVRGNVVRTTDPEGGTTRFAYDRRGFPTALTDALGHTTTLEWDYAGNLVKTTDRTGAETEMQYDALGRLVQRFGADDGATRFWRDALGRIVRLRDAAGHHAHFQYDGVGNLVAATDPLRRTRRFHYAPLGPGGVLTGLTEPTGATTTYRYDREGDLTEVEDATGRRWRFDRDLLGRVTTERDFAGRRLHYAYDALGQVTATTNARGQTTTLTRDTAGRLTARSYADGADETFAYDAAGRLTEAANNAATVTFTYDGCGRLTEETQNGEAIRHRYDRLGNRTQRTAPTGPDLRFRYDAEGRLAEIHTPEERLLAVERDRLGREVRRLLPSGLVGERHYGFGGELLDQVLYDPADFDPVQARTERRPRFARRYDYDAAGQLRTLTDSHFGARTFTHDLDGRLAAVTHPEGALERFLYDEAGNVPAAPRHLGVPTAAPGGDGAAGDGYGGIPISDDVPLTERIGTVRRVDGWTLVYDLDGNLVAKRSSRAAFRFHYDAAGRLASAERDGREVARFAYDALGRRVRKDTPTQATTYLWDGDALLAERTEVPSGNSPALETSRSYLFQGFEPLAVFAEAGATSTTAIIECDQVGTPRLAVSTEGALVWEASFTGYGALDAEHGTLTLDLRFPGQLYDDETGLAYNRFRYYDAALRCYTQADPIGLAGGLQAHGYVQDPAAWVDPLGLSGCKSRRRIVIGENMERVHRYAQMIGAQAYRPWPNDPWDFELGMRRNRRWIRDQMRAGAEIIDIGPDFRRRLEQSLDPDYPYPPRSPFYTMERQETRDYPITKVFARNGEFDGGVPGFDY